MHDKPKASGSNTPKRGSANGPSGGGAEAGKRGSTDRAAGDLALMQRIARNEEAAVAELYDRFGSLVYRMAYQALPTRADADDAVQEVFVRIWRTADRYDPKRAALVTWVMLISRRHLVDRMRRAGARIKPGVLDEQIGVADKAGADSDEAIQRRERFAALMDKIAELPELQQTVVTRAYLGGQTLRQIGEELDTPLGTIKSALSRALVRLRENTAGGAA